MISHPYLLEDELPYINLRYRIAALMIDRSGVSYKRKTLETERIHSNTGTVAIDHHSQLNLGSCGNDLEADAGVMTIDAETAFPGTSRSESNPTNRVRSLLLALIRLFTSSPRQSRDTTPQVKPIIV